MLTPKTSSMHIYMYLYTVCVTSSFLILSLPFVIHILLHYILCIVHLHTVEVHYGVLLPLSLCLGHNDLVHHFTLFADLGTLKADDTVHKSVYSPLLLAEKTNVLFATTPMSSIMAKGGNILFTCLILPQLLEESPRIIAHSLTLSGRAKYVKLSRPDITRNATLLPKMASFNRVIGLWVGDGRRDQDRLPEG